MLLRPDTEFIEAFCDNQMAIMRHYIDNPPPPEPHSPD